jgi:hypothetical protein
MSPRSKQKNGSGSKKKKRPRLAYKKWSADRKPGDAHTRVSFCRSNAISEALYYKLKREGKGPREIEFDGRIIITPEAEADWRREREAETAKERAEKQAKAAAEAAATTAVTVPL